MNFPVVTGGFAVIAVLGQTQALGALGLGGASSAIFSASFISGAAGLLGMFKPNNLCMKVQIVQKSR